MLCLGIESSCDECALALVRDGKLVDHALASQADLHAIFGGVVPELASREHYRHIGPLYDLLLGRNSLEGKDLDYVAVTRGPGLLGSLLVGAAFAKSLALALDIPILGINHLHAHLLAVGLEQQLQFPAIGLLVSGGHTQLYLIEAPDKFTQLGHTLDDAAGEAFDKIGQMLKLPYPAGEKMDLLAQQGQEGNFPLPRPYLDNDSLDFSFSGLKTAASILIKKNPSFTDPDQPGHKAGLAGFCASLNRAIADILENKLQKALAKYPQCRSVWLAGGVAANSEIRTRISALAVSAKVSFLAPSPGFCGDNGAMIAYTGEILGNMGYSHGLDFETFPRGQKIPFDMYLSTPGGRK